jgi:hypothetical protein
MHFRRLIKQAIHEIVVVETFASTEPTGTLRRLGAPFVRGQLLCSLRQYLPLDLFHLQVELPFFSFQPRIRRSVVLRRLLLAAGPCHRPKRQIKISGRLEKAGPLRQGGRSWGLFAQLFAAHGGSKR